MTIITTPYDKQTRYWIDKNGRTRKTTQAAVWWWYVDTRIAMACWLNDEQEWTYN